jgi:hypothetical protein
MVCVTRTTVYRAAAAIHSPFPIFIKECIIMYMGIDVGTQGVRCVISDESGRLAAAKSVPFRVLNISEHPGWYEQAPEHWQAAAEEAAEPSEISCFWKTLQKTYRKG